MKQNRLVYTLFCLMIVPSVSCAEPTIVARESNSMITRLSKLEHQLQYLLDQNYTAQLNDLQKELTEVRGKNSELTQKIAQLTQRLHELASNRNEEMKNKNESRVEDTTAAEAKLYQAALDLMEKAPLHSQQKLATYLKTYPKGLYRAKARYWLGECYFLQRKYETAAQTWQFFIQQFPRNDLIPEALLKLALTELKLKRVVPASKLLNRLIEEHPKTKAAKLARLQLAQLK